MLRRNAFAPWSVVGLLPACLWQAECKPPDHAAAMWSPVDCGSTASVFAACLPVAGSVQNAAVWSPVDGCRPKTKKRNTNVI